VIRLGLRLTLGSGRDAVLRVLVTHESRVAAYADREVIVRDGRVTTTAAAAG